MKKYILCAIMVLGVFSTTAMAKDFRVGVVNVAEILKASPQATHIRDEMQKKFKPRQEKLVALQKAIEADKEKLTREGTVMAKSKRTALQDKIQEENRNLQRDQQAFMQDVQFSQKKAMRDLTTKLNAAVEKLAAQKNFDLILQNDQVVFASKSADITQIVLDELKAEK